MGLNCLRTHIKIADPRYYEGEVHAFHAFIFRENARLCWQHTYEFLDRHAPAIDSNGR